MNKRLGTLVLLAAVFQTAASLAADLPPYPSEEAPSTQTHRAATYPRHAAVHPKKPARVTVFVHAYPVCLYDTDPIDVESATRHWPEFKKDLLAGLKLLDRSTSATFVSSNVALVRATANAHIKASDVWPAIGCFGERNSQLNRQLGDICRKFLAARMRLEISKSPMPKDIVEPSCISIR